MNKYVLIICLSSISITSYCQIDENIEGVNKIDSTQILINEKTELQNQLITELADKISAINERNEGLVKENESLKNLVEGINSNQESIAQTTKNNNDQIKSLLTSTRLKEEQQYNIVKENLENSSKTLALSANVIQQLDLNIDQNIKNANDNLLSNPESGVLGFKLSDVIEENAKALFTKSSDLNQFMQSVQSVSNSELVRSITPAPALSIANSILNILHSLSFSTKRLDVEKINEFEKKFAPYVLYYEKSSKADEQFITSNQVLKSQLNAATNDLTNQIELILRNEGFLNDLAISKNDSKPGDRSNVDYLQDIIRIYSEKKLDNYFDDIEDSYKKGNTIEYADILLQKPYLKEVNNLLDKMTEYGAILEFIEKEYLRSYRQYNQAKLNALSIAPKNEENRAIIENLMKRTERESNDLIEKERKAIDIKSLQRNLETAKYSIKLI